MTDTQESSSTGRTDQRDRTTSRRDVLRAGAIGAFAGSAGCLGSIDGLVGDDDDAVETAPEYPEIEDPPDRAYVPTHREAMRMLDPIEAGEFTLAPMLSYQHQFWLVKGDDVVPQEPEEDGGVHVMCTVWDAETGVVLPVDSGVELRLERDGERVGSPLRPWPMISQQMGFHFGDNVSLEEYGTYTAEVRLPPIGVEKTGAFEGRFEEAATATFEFEYDEAFLEEVVDGVEYLDEDHWGRPGALAPMDHGGGGDDHDGHGGDGEHDGHGDGMGHDDEMDHDGHAHVPYSSLPPAEEYPGTLLLEPAEGDDDEDVDDRVPTSGDARFVLTLLESGSRLADDGERYLLVSPRTPHNRVPLADTALSVTVGRDGDAVFEGDLEQTLDDEFDLHYGVGLPDVEPGDAVTVTAESPPQVARHRGYETAFIEMPPVEVRVPGEVRE